MKTPHLGWIATVLLVPAMCAQAGVVVGDREWRQLTDTIDLTWNQVAAVCSTTTGACGGSIGAVSFDGWTWASIEDVQELFEQLIKPDSIEFPTIDTNYQALDDPDIQAALGPDGFTPVPAGFGPTRTGGWTRSPFRPAIPDYYFAPYLLLDATSELEDLACLYCAGPITEDANGYRGNWMYRPATPELLLQELQKDVTVVGPGKSLANKIADAQAYYASGDVVAACAKMTAFLNQVSAQAGKKKLSDAEAAALTEQANTVRTAMGCN